MAVAADGEKSPKSGGQVGHCRRRRRTGRNDNDICVSRKRGGWQRRLSGGRGAEEYEVLDDDDITDQLFTDLLPPGIRGFYLGKLLKIARK